MQMRPMTFLQLAFCCCLRISALVVDLHLCCSCLSASVWFILNVLLCMHDSGVACLMPSCSNHTSEMQNVFASMWETSVGVCRYYCLVVYLIAPFFSVINAYCAGKPPYTLLLPCDVPAM